MHTIPEVSDLCEQQLKQWFEIAHQSILEKHECFCQKQRDGRTKTTAGKKKPTKTMQENSISTQVVPRKHGRSTNLTDVVPNNNQANVTFRRCQSKDYWAGFSENPHFSEIEHSITPTALPSKTFGKRLKRSDNDHAAMRIHTNQGWKAHRKWMPLKASMQRSSPNAQHPVMTTIATQW